jgi:RNA polymerase sigma-70 factor (ECF subfamily)
MGDSGLAAAGDPIDRAGEEKLVLQAIEGDAEAFGRLYSLYLDAIYRFLYFRVGRPTVAEDLTEKVFFKAWTSMGSYEHQGVRFSSWLYRIARNAVIDYHRVSRSHVILTDEFPTLAEEEELSPLQLVLRREEVEELQVAISQLPEEQKQVLILRFTEGLSHAQVAEIVGKTEEACRVIQHRALAALSRILSETG